MNRNNNFQRNNNFRRNNNFNNGPRKMYKAICSECKKECEVPFKPTPGREVFCQECFAKRRPKRY